MTDPLIQEIDRIKDGLAGAARDAKRTYDESAIGRTQKELTAWTKFWSQVFRGLYWAWSYTIKPLMNVAMRVLRRMLALYKRLWDLVVYRVDEYGVRRFIKTRAGLMVLATAGALYVSSELLELVADTVLYVVTAQRDEQVYLIMSQEIDPKHNIHAARGCEALPCSDHNSIYFRIRPTMFNHLWSLYHTGNVFFPDYVAAAAPAGASKCIITSYGVRIKFLMRGLDWYPDILAISCAQRDRT